MWTILYFSSAYVSDFTADTCSKHTKQINHYLLGREPEKLCQLPTPFQVNVQNLPEIV